MSAGIGAALGDPNIEIYATLGEPHEVAATLSDLRYLVFQGMKGDTGDSAYEVAVALGFVGTEAEWIASLKGEKGDSGAVFLELKTVSNRQVITYNGEQITGAEIDAMYLNGALPVVEYSGHIFLPNKNCYNPGSPSARNTSFMFCRPVSAIETTFISVRYDSSVVNIINDMVYPYFDSGDDEGKVLTVGDDDTVHWETPQGGTAANAVLYTAQSLSDLQKAQARTNVGAGTYSKPASGIPASDLAAGVIPDISGKANAADVYTKTEVDQKLVGAMDYKGTKATVSALPTSGNETGDVWHITADGSEWAWNGSAWEELGSAVDLSGYRTASAQDAIDTAQDSAIAAKYTKPIGGIPDSDIASAAVWNAKGTYSKPSTGIPASDLAAGVIPVVPQMATAADMSDWTSGKTVDASLLKTGFQSAGQSLALLLSEVSDLDDNKADKTELPDASTSAPAMDGTAAVGTSTDYARADHIHPSDTTRLSTTGNAYRSASIPMGHLDATSTATVMTATVDGITELRDGVCMWLRNGVVTSASGFTLNVNSLGAKPCYSSLAAASRSTTIFNVNYTMLLIYNSTRVDGGCWDIVYGVDTNTTYTPVKLGFGYTTCSTAEATTAKTASLSSYTLTANGIVSVKFTNAVPANSTLNIASKGAKAMYYRGNPITTGVIKAGDTATFVYSTYYHLISIDRDEAGDTLPAVTASDNGKFLRVVSGAWAAQTVPSAESNSFGGGS